MRGIIAWKLPERDRALLLRAFPPAYPDVVAHHVTHVFNAKDTDPRPGGTRGEIIGIADDGEGVQALVVRMPTARPDGKAHHVTWSLDRAKGRKPVESNTVIADLGYRPITPIIIELEPGFFPHGSL